MSKKKEQNRTERKETNHCPVSIEHYNTRGRMHDQRISPFIAFIFYPPFKLDILARLKCIWDYPVSLNAFKELYSLIFLRLSSLNAGEKWLLP